nr:putative acetyltransferase [uncultured Mediterranean phage uvMED]
MQMLRPLDPSTTSFLDDADRCKKWIVDALKYAHNSHTFEQVIEIVKRGDAQLWAFEDSAIVTEIINYPQRRTLRFWLAGGNLETLLEVEPKIRKWSILYNCKAVEIIGRKGWGKVLKDYEPTATVFIKEY